MPPENQKKIQLIMSSDRVSVKGVRSGLLFQPSPAPLLQTSAIFGGSYSKTSKCGISDSLRGALNYSLPNSSAM
jgi:hypothetical protein